MRAVHRLPAVLPEGVDSVGHDDAPHVEPALAKLTLSLRVTGVRADGYHLIDAEMVTVDLCDTLELRPGRGIEVVSAATGLPVPTGEDNTVQRALTAIGRSAHVRLHKRIPAGAGLGGGSADAAAVFRWADVDDPDLAASIGSDVPFCVVGGRARVTGIGEIVEPLPPIDRTFTIAIPPFGCSTPAVYAAWDQFESVGARVRAAHSRNDLEPAALAVEPRLVEWRDQLGKATGKTPTLAGSGSAWFVDGAFPGDGRIVVQTAAPQRRR